jgi:hypothetical protein
VSAASALASEVREALAALGMAVSDDGGELTADGATIGLPLVERAHPHPGEVAELVAAADGPALLVADRLSEGARQVLRDAGWSWLDRRGHARVWVPGLRIDAPIGLGGDRARGASTSPWTPVGFEVALHALIHPGEEVSARRIARDTGRSPGGTQEILARFVAEGLVGRASRLPLLPDLFWETAARWPDDGWIGLAAPLGEVADLAGSGSLLRVDERAATLGGARIAAAGDLPARCYLDKSGLRRVRPALASAGEGARTWVRPAPVRWLPELEGYEPDDAHPWKVAHPMLCAIRLAGEGARGREIVEDWGIVPGDPT